MADPVDHDGEALFTNVYQHSVVVYQDTGGPKDIDVIKTNGNLWFSGNQVMEVMGFGVNDTGNSGRTLRRIDHPDVIKITDTPFKFTDGRRNRGKLISPRAVMVFVSGKTKGFNSIKAFGFSSWVTDNVLEGHDASHWSPAKQEVNALEPVFRKVIEGALEDDREHFDPLRPTGPYPATLAPPPLQPDEIEFCVGNYSGCANRADCWCDLKGGIRTYEDQQRSIHRKMMKDHLRRTPVSDEVIDEEDDFSELDWLSRSSALSAADF